MADRGEVGGGEGVGFVRKDEMSETENTVQNWNRSHSRVFSTNVNIVYLI